MIHTVGVTLPERLIEGAAIEAGHRWLRRDQADAVAEVLGFRLTHTGAALLVRLLPSPESRNVFVGYDW